MHIVKPLRSVLLALSASSGALFAQSVPTTTPAATDGTVVLSPFSVSGQAAERYKATEATSGTRVRMSLMDSTQSVSVVTRDLIEDVGAGRILDAAKYVSGVYESTIPNAQDRSNIRGFQNDGATVDGFNYFSFANLDPVIIDRIEVVKGPNAIIAPQGLPGGTVNNVTKKPFFADRGSVSVQVGEYYSDRAEFDINRVVESEKLAVRFVGSAQSSPDYGQHNHHSSTMAMPMFTYRFSPTTQLTVQGQWSNWWSNNFGGIPVSVYTGSNDVAKLTNGVPRDFMVQNNDIPRHMKSHQYRAFFTANLTENLSTRVVGNFMQESGKSVQLNIGNATVLPVKLNPLTGFWAWDGVTINDNPLFPLGGTLNFQYRTYANLQHDFVYDLKTAEFQSTTVAGYAINFSNTRDEFNENFTLPSPMSLQNYVFAPYTITNATSLNTRTYRDQQIYINEALTLLNKHLILSAGVSRDWYQSRNFDKFRNLHADVAPDATLPSFGVVYKPISNVSLYYGYSKQATAIAPSTTSVNLLTTQASRQHEFGIRTQLVENRLYATLAYFDIKQNNFSVPNPLNNSVPPPSPLLPALFMDRKAHGVELEFNYAVSKAFSLVGNATIMKNRDPNNVPFRGTAEKSGAIWGNYIFEKNSSLSGFSAGVGADYLARRPGDSASGLTSASTPANPIPVQPSFWLPARTLVNANVAYRWTPQWRSQLNVENLLDEKYFAASGGRLSVIAGAPINFKFSTTYSF